MMIIINIVVFLTTFILGYLIGWRKGYEDVLKLVALCKMDGALEEFLSKLGKEESDEVSVDEEN